MFLSMSFPRRGGRGRFVALAILACMVLLLLPRGAVADPPVTVPNRPVCRVFCFRITDIRCDDVVENRYHIEFEVLNWSNAWAGGVQLKLSGFSDVGIGFVDPPSGPNTNGIDADGRPLIWEDINEDGLSDVADLEDIDFDGLLDGGEDKNGNGRLDNDPIPGNFGRPNGFQRGPVTSTDAMWTVINPFIDAIPFINLVGTRNCTKCIEDLPQRVGPALVGIDGSGNVDPLEWVDNGDNVQDGFVVTIDGMEPGKVAHINWFLLGAGIGVGGTGATPEPFPAGDCREGLPNAPLGQPIGTVGQGNAYGFGLVSLFRMDGDRLPKGTFQGQTGFAQTATEFYDGVYNVPPSPNFECGSFGMEFTPGTTCDLGDFDRENRCPLGVQAIPGQTAVRMPKIDGKIGKTEWDGATVIPLHQASRADKPSLSTAWIKVNCVTNKWYVRTEINPEEGVTHMLDSPEDQFVKLGITGQLGGAQVDGNDAHKLPGEPKEPWFRYVYKTDDEGEYVLNDKSERIIIGWEACFEWKESEQPNFMKIHTQVWANFTEDPEGETSATLGTNPNNMFQVCVCGGQMFPSIPGNCKPIDTKCGGDPHFSTWSGEKFTFHGECDLVLIRNPAFAEGLGMHVHGRTKIHDGWSDMESIAIQIGRDIFEARGAHEYWINGRRNAQLPALVGGYQVSLQQLNARRGRLAYVVHLGGEKELHVKAFGSMMWVQIKGQQSNLFEGSDGLFGNFESGHMAGRDGTIIKIANDYGQEWQVRPDLDDPVLFHVADGPQYPELCAMPPHSNNNMKDLMDDEGVRVAIAKKACAHAPQHEMEDCVFDVVTTRNVDVAEAY